jgi:hypothetical protein
VICVLGHHRDAVRAGAALALRLRVRADIAVVSVWGTEVPGPSELVGRGAARCARRLAGEGHDARGAGRLVQVALPATSEHALAAIERIDALASGLVHVVVIAGPRDPAFDALLRTADAVLIARSRSQPSDVADLAREALTGLCPRTAIIELGGARPTAALTAAGLLVPPRLREAVTQALGAAGALPA